jgi:hypothetical protein
MFPVFGFAACRLVTQKCSSQNLKLAVAGTCFTLRSFFAGYRHGATCEGIESMKKILVFALAATVLGAPMADAQSWNNNHRNNNNRHDNHVQRYPKGWGPHRGPDRSGYYHGYRGYRDRRPGYRRGHDGMWYPAAAFALGAILGGALNN